jgi:hypothetical protein
MKDHSDPLFSGLQPPDKKVAVAASTKKHTHSE